MNIKQTRSYYIVRKIYLNFKNMPYNIQKAIDTSSLKKFNNKHEGEVCFIIGNGPSMTVSDLDKIHELGVKSFACNKIFLVFDETKWRPDYYFVSDSKIVKDINFEETGLKKKHMFFPRKFKHEVGFGNFYELLEHNWLEHGGFSTNAYKGIYQCETIIAEAIQMAYYMGFAKVYIIGVDFNYNMQSVNKENLTFVSGGNNYFIKGYEKPGEVLNLGNEYSNILGFQAAREGFENNGREIYNATRGGKLEVFIRKNLDSIFEEMEMEK